MKPLLVGAAILAICASRAMAFNPPEDKAGPLTLRIEGPSKVTASEAPQAVHISLTNRSGQPIMGSLRVHVIDKWRVEPAEAKSFALEKDGSVQLDYTVAAGKGTYSALYPVHAFAEFEAGGAKHTAHAVLIIETQLPDAPRPDTSAPWTPAAVPANGELSLLRVSGFRTVIQVFGEAAQTLSPGWHGSDGRTRASVYPESHVGRPDVRESMGIHPPWYQGLAGSALVEYPIRLPEGMSIRLHFATAIRDNAPTEPASDGVTFRVRVAPMDAPDGAFGEVLFEKHSDAKTWQDADVDLSRFAGQTIRLQLESHPGPKNDTTCDASYWANPTVFAGTPAPAAEAPFTAEKQLGVIRQGDRQYGVRVRLGQRGLLDGEVAFSAGEKTLSFRGFAVRVAGDRIDARNGTTEFLGVAEEPAEHSYKLRHRFRGAQGPFDLLAELRVEDEPALHVKFWLEHAPDPRPWSVVCIEDVAAGPWNEHATQVYAGVGNVIREPQAFELGFDGHQLSTSFVGFDFANGISLVSGVDVPPSKLEVTPDKRVYTLHAPLTPIMTFIPTANVWDGVRIWREMLNGTRQPGAGVKKLAGRFVFDLWGGGYASSAQALERMFRYGLTHSVVVWHNWQRWGYDYRLPDIYPPNPEYGTLEEFQALAKVCEDHGALFAPHDNYIDLYPDAEGFTYDNVAFTRDGEPIRAWLNEGRGAQAYRWNSAAYRPFMERNVKLIRDSFAPTAYFIDVWSSIGPYESWTHDGQFQDRMFTRDAWGETFAWIRKYLGDGAPMISESGHDQLIGFLEGAQTNHLRVDANPPKGSEWMVWRIPCADAERVPWFDAAHHGYFVGHGAGYESRYLGGLGADLHGINSDDYITSEVTTGHPPMVAPPFDHNMVRKYWLLHDLMDSLAFASIRHVEFVDNDLHRQRIAWGDSNGGTEIWVNRGDADWAIPSVLGAAQAVVLPPYGFYAYGIGRVDDPKSSRMAEIVREDGIIVERSYSGENGTHYVNARPVMDGRLPVRVRVESVRGLPDRKLETVFRWESERPLEESLNPFVHFVDAAGKILFQADHPFTTPTTQWQGPVQSTAVCEIPSSLHPGDAVDLRVGLWRPDLGRRTLRGMCDGEQRLRLGTVKFEGAGPDVANAVWTPLEETPDPGLARLNPDRKMIRFGPIETNGAFRLMPEADAYLLTPLPGCPAFTAKLAKRSLPFSNGRAVAQVEALAEDGTVLKSMPTHPEGDYIILECEPQVFAYRLR